MSADPQQFVALAGHVSLRRLETPCLYDRRQDELYELNEEGLAALANCRGQLRLAEAGLEPDFQEFCLAEGLLTLSPEPRPRPLALGPGPLPSLRYLEMQITWRCNLACAHCYLGPARGVDLAVERVAALAREFEAMGGLRLLISGGEPLMHPQWPEVNSALMALPVRRVLLTNGLLLSEKILAGLAAEEVQISLDGLAAGHQALRGPRSFEKAVAAARRVRAAGLDLSVATMVHPGNLGEMEGLAELVESLGAREWGIDAPCLADRLGGNPALSVTPQQAAQAMVHAFGGSYHGSGADETGRPMACGLHLCTVAADGRVAQCGFYLDQPLGRSEDGLWTCWARRKAKALSEIQGCATCEAGPDCGGGCRYRAPAPDQPDPVMCVAMGREPPTIGDES